MPLHVIEGVPLLQRGVRGLLAGSSSVSVHVVSRPIKLRLSLLSLATYFGALRPREMEGSSHRTLEEIVQVP